MSSYASRGPTPPSSAFSGYSLDLPLPQHVYTACSSLWEREMPLGQLDVRGFEQYSKLIDSSEIKLPIK